MGVFTEFCEASTIHGLSYIASSKSFAKLVWITIVVTCFTFAGILIHQSFQSWEESPIKTTVQTLPISEISFPKVTVCPPKNTFTNLNYDLHMAEKMTFEDDTRTKLLKIAIETLDDHFVEEAKLNFTQIEQKNIFFNWYNGFTKISMPSYSGKLIFKIDMTSTEGAVETKYFRQDFDKSKLNQGMSVTINIHVPENVRNSSNITLMVHCEVEKITNLSFTSSVRIEFGEKYKFYYSDYNKQRGFKFNVTFPGKSYYEFKYYYRIVDKDFQNLNLSKMPGFNLQWKYSVDVNADRKFLVDNREYDGDLVYNRVFIR